MTIISALNQIEKDKVALYNEIMEIFEAGEDYPSFTIESHYEQFIISIFKYFLMSLYPDKFLVTYVIGSKHDSVSHAFKSWYVKLSGGNIKQWLKANHLTDTDKFVNGMPLKKTRSI